MSAVHQWPETLLAMHDDPMIREVAELLLPEPGDMRAEVLNLTDL